MTVDINDQIDVFKTALASELAIDVNEILDDVEFSDLGLNSIPSLSVLNKLRAEIDQSFPLSLFKDHRTLSDIRRFLTAKASASLPAESSLAMFQHNSVSCTSVILSGPGNRDAATVFLLPDGLARQVRI